MRRTGRRGETLRVHQAIIITTVLALAGCGDPLAEVDRLSDVDVVEETPTQEIVADANDAPPQGILATLFGRGRAAPKDAGTETARESDEAVAEATDAPQASGPADASVDAEEPMPEPEAPGADTVAEVAPEPEVKAESAKAEPRRGGFLGLFRRADKADPVPAKADAQVDADTAPGAVEKVAKLAGEISQNYPKTLATR